MTFAAERVSNRRGQGGENREDAKKSMRREGEREREGKEEGKERGKGRKKGREGSQEAGSTHCSCVCCAQNILFEGLVVSTVITPLS